MRSWVSRTIRTPPQVRSSTTTKSQRLMLSSPRSPRASSGSLMTSTTTTSSSVRRSSVRAEVEPITLKESCLSSSSMSQDGTWKPVVCRDASHAQGHEIQVQNTGNEQIRTFRPTEGANPRQLSGNQLTRIPG